MKTGIHRFKKRARYLVVFSIFSFTAADADSSDTDFTTSDGVRIAATVTLPMDSDNKVPAVIFIHQGGSSKEEWTSLPLFRQVAANGMLALAYDVRGHGNSGGKADFSTLFDDPNQSPLDLAAAVEWLQQSGKVDMSRVAIVGASIGANLACVGIGSRQFSISTAVAMSAKVSAIYNLAGGHDQLMDFRSVFFIASELEQDGLRATWATELYEMAAGPRKLEIVAGSSGHGVSVFDDDPSLQEHMLEWLLQTI